MRYAKLYIMAGLSFISMYILMYAMVDRYVNIYNNTNQLFMAALMTMPMIIIELLIMKDMYTDKKHNFIILVTSISIFITSLLFIRTQIITTDKDFLRSLNCAKILLKRNSLRFSLCRKN
jgi:hypothetical protein